MTATPLCTQAQFAAKACPANTQVGTTATHATAYPTPITGLAVDVPGKLYNLAPVGRGARAAGHPPDPDVGRRDPAAVDRHRAPGRRRAWTRAPTACRGRRPSAPSTSTPSTSRCSARRAIRPRASSPTRRRARWPPRRSTPSPTTARRARARPRSRRPAATSSPSPRRSAPPSTPGAKGGRPTLTTVVESPAGPGQRAQRADHASRRPRRPGDHAQPRLPRGRVRPGRVRGQRPDRQRQGRDARRSPPRSRGPVVLVKPAASPLPELIIDLHGPIALRLPVTVGFGAGGRLQSTLDGLPDTALSRFTLTLAGGPDGLLSNARDLCTGPDRARRRDLRRARTARARARRSSRRSPAASRRSGPRSRACARAIRCSRCASRAPLGQRLTSVGVSLPRTLRVDRRRARKATTVLAGGRKVAQADAAPRPARRSRWAGCRRTGRARSSSHVKRGALRIARRLRAGQTVKLTLATADAAGGKQKLPLTVRAAR